MAVSIALLVSTMGAAAEASALTIAPASAQTTVAQSTSAQTELAREGKKVYARIKAAPRLIRNLIIKRLTPRQRRALEAYLKAKLEDSSGQSRPQQSGCVPRGHSCPSSITTAQADPSAPQCYAWDRTESASNILGWGLWDFTLTIYWCVNADHTKVYNTSYKVDPDVHSLMISYKQVSVEEKTGDGSMYDVVATGEFQSCIGFQGLGCFQSRYPHIHIHVEARTHNYYDQGQ